MNKDDSWFYNLFPSQKSIRSKVTNIEGYFEDLTQYVSAGFDGKQVAESGVFAKDYSEGGIFFYTDMQKAFIEKAKFRGEKANILKYSEMVGYLFEVAYDLAICPSNNVSRSPGFEAFGFDL